MNAQQHYKVSFLSNIEMMYNPFGLEQLLQKELKVRHYQQELSAQIQEKRLRIQREQELEKSFNITNPPMKS